MRKLWAFAEGADGFVVETGIAGVVNAHASIHDSPLQLGKENWVTFY